MAGLLTTLSNFYEEQTVTAIVVGGAIALWALKSVLIRPTGRRAVPVGAYAEPANGDGNPGETPEYESTVPKVRAPRSSLLLLFLLLLLSVTLASRVWSWCAARHAQDT